MKRAFLIAGGTVGGLGAVLAITPPQFTSTQSVDSLSGGLPMGSAKQTAPAATQPSQRPTATKAATTKSAVATQSAKPASTKKASTQPSATASATQSASSAPTASVTPTPSATHTTAAPAPAATPVQDDRNWWQRNMPSFLGGRDAPTSSEQETGTTKKVQRGERKPIIFETGNLGISANAAPTAAAPRVEALWARSNLSP